MRRATGRTFHRRAAPRHARPAVAPGRAAAAALPPEPEGPPPAGRPRGGGPEIQLAWGLDRDGAKVHVSALDAKTRRSRAPFRCLGCGDPLVPHLGEVRAHHFAHEPGSRCPLTAPETALHLNAKERLLWLCGEAFAGRLTVTVLTRCPECRRLAPRALAALGDAAEAEGAVGALRADVLVRAAGAPALAIEVKVTHAVDAAKEAALAAAGVPAVEIDAREEWEREVVAAAAPQAAGPLPERAAPACDLVVARTIGFPPCPSCAAQVRAAGDLDRGGEAAAIAELERLRARRLLGPAPGPPRSGGTDERLSVVERQAIAARFRCPECGGRSLIAGDRLLRHRCAGDGEARPVAWRGYDGALIELGWWGRGGRP